MGKKEDILQNDDILTKDEVAKMLHISTQTLKMKRSEGKLAAIKLGPKKYVYRRSDVDAFLRRSTIQADSGLDAIVSEIARMSKEDRERLKEEIKKIEAVEQLVNANAEAD